MRKSSRLCANQPVSRVPRGPRRVDETRRDNLISKARPGVAGESGSMLSVRRNAGRCVMPSGGFIDCWLTERFMARRAYV